MGKIALRNIQDLDTADKSTAVNDYIKEISESIPKILKINSPYRGHALKDKCF